MAVQQGVNAAEHAEAMKAQQEVQDASQKAIGIAPSCLQIDTAAGPMDEDGQAIEIDRAAVKVETCSDSGKSVLPL